MTSDEEKTKKRKRAMLLPMVLIFCLLVMSLSGCMNRWKKFVVYEPFKGEYTTNCFDVSCDWETINPLLEKCNFEEYGLYPTSFDASMFEFEEVLNLIVLYNYSQTDNSMDVATPISIGISYGAQYCNSAESINHAGEQYFTEPMIQIHLYNFQANNGETEPDYLEGYRAVYSLDGELALEEGSWFIDEDKDEFCRHYLEIMLEIIGKAH